MSRRRARVITKAELRRRSPFRRANKIVLIVCEGTKTEPEYFGDFRRHERVMGVTLKCVGMGEDPLRVVLEAEKLRGNRLAQARRGADIAFDEVWAVFDVDHHDPERLREAMREATQLEISTAISNPCFELWFVLHFHDLFAYVTRQDLVNRLRAVWPEYDKVLPYRLLHGRCGNACARAMGLDRAREGDNPSTGIWKLVRSLMGEGVGLGPGGRARA